MKHIEFGEQLTFEDEKDYICYGIVTNDNKNYIFLSNVTDKNDTLIAEEKFINNDLSLEIVEDNNMLQNLKKLFIIKYSNK